MEEKKARKKINWNLWKIRCPHCNSTSIEKLNLYKEIYVPYYNLSGESLKLKELQKMKCKNCSRIFWK